MRGLDVLHDDLQALERAGGHLREPRADRDRAGRAGRRELDETELLADGVVMFGDEAGPLKDDWDAVLSSRFTAQQLDVVIDFLRATNEVGRRHFERVRDQTES